VAYICVCVYELDKWETVGILLGIDLMPIAPEIVQRSNSSGFYDFVLSNHCVTESLSQVVCVLGEVSFLGRFP